MTVIWQYWEFMDEKSEFRKMKGSEVIDMLKPPAMPGRTE
jgi:hypothetical protein